MYLTNFSVFNVNWCSWVVWGGGGEQLTGVFCALLRGVTCAALSSAHKMQLLLTSINAQSRQVSDRSSTMTLVFIPLALIFLVALLVCGYGGYGKSLAKN